MKKLFVFVFLITCFLAYCDEIDFTESIYSKASVNFSDGVVIFCYLYNIEIKDNFEDNAGNLKNLIKYFPKKYSAEKDLTIGDFSLFAIQYLKIKSGLFYLASHSGRYASRELIIRNIIPLNTSEYEKISGQDLIILVQKVVDYEEKK